MRDLTCKELVELVTAYFEDALPAEERISFERHITLCPGCAVYVEQLRQTMTLTGALREVDVSAEAEQSLRRAFRDWRRDDTAGG